MSNFSMLGFYTHLKFTTDANVSDEDVTKEDFAEYIRENIFGYETQNWKFNVSRDGLVQFQRKSLEKEIKDVRQTWIENFSLAPSFEPFWVKYLRDLNVIYFLLDCSAHLNFNVYAFQYYELTYLDTVRVEYDKNGNFLQQLPYRGTDLAELFRRGILRPGDKKSFIKADLPANILDNLVSYYLTKVLDNEEFMTLLHRTAKSFSEHNLRNYENSIIISWFILETYINQLWDMLLADKKIEGKRKRKLQDRDYTASVKTEILQLQGRIDDNQYEKLNYVRSIRNKIAHEYIEFKASANDSAQALELIKTILKDKINLDFPFCTTGFPIYGL